MNEKKLEIKPLIISIFIISICSIVYELIIAGTSTYLLGNSIKQFSITIGLYMSAMGVGSYLSKYIKKNLFDFFITIELSIGFIGGLSALILFVTYAKTDFYVPMMYLIIIIIGIFVGLEIPILTRMIEKYNKDLRVTLANVLSFDYIGGLIGSVGFPMILYPHLGLIRTSFLMGALNIAVAGMILFRYKEFITKVKFFKGLFGVFMVVTIFGLVTGDITADNIEKQLYRDQIIFKTQTQYQKIVMTRHKDDIRVFLDGNIQFSSIDEYRYHEALVHPIMSSLEKPRNVLVLGGGDGLALREIFKYPSVKKIDLVDIDQEMVEFCRDNELIKEINKGSLEDARVSLHYEDAFKFLEKSEEVYDAVIVDLPDPNNESLNKLYTDVFYRLIGNHLSSQGKFVVQSTSPYYATKAFWCINKTITEEEFKVIPYHLEVPSFGDWGFQLASKEDFNLKSIDIKVHTEYLIDSSIGKMMVFGKDEIVDMMSIESNKIFRPILLTYYEEAESKY
ncbi:polyamine aminopropyltransferase [Oceanirhabdus seepicola]|uniref:Polyamine aminopropyltransferase n=1 Tax=Oceanirhabdus seepicola TaxID=2828781 RepID=A0A9J6P3P4_9CLOT|nr:polyamine aminopropyltransferase [Oceanirhabdus seepicola]MCM1990689.1 polyamine aminopropyltransferase [Oceanirhabdus seepicola]